MTPDNTALHLKELLVEVAAIKDENARLREYALSATITITGLTPGGSEYFAGQIGEIYVADLPKCEAAIRVRTKNGQSILVREKRKSLALIDENERLRDAASSARARLSFCAYHFNDLHIAHSEEACWSEIAKIDAALNTPNTAPPPRGS